MAPPAADAGGAAVVPACAAPPARPALCESGGVAGADSAPACCEAGSFSEQAKPALQSSIHTIDRSTRILIG